MNHLNSLSGLNHAIVWLDQFKSLAKLAKRSNVAFSKTLPCLSLNSEGFLLKAKTRPCTKSISMITDQRNFTLKLSNKTRSFRCSAVYFRRCESYTVLCLLDAVVIKYRTNWWSSRLRNEKQTSRRSRKHPIKPTAETNEWTAQYLICMPIGSVSLRGTRMRITRAVSDLHELGRLLDSSQRTRCSLLVQQGRDCIRSLRPRQCCWRSAGHETLGSVRLKSRPSWIHVIVRRATSNVYLDMTSYCRASVGKLLDHLSSEQH